MNFQILTILMIDFNTPTLLWGLFGLAVPILIHFWHQKQGKRLDWAATQWLSEKNLQQARGIRLDNIWLLILRLAIVLLLCLALAKPLWNTFQTSSSFSKIHLIEPNTLVTNNFRFEIEGALKKGEPCFWIENSPSELKDLSEQPKEIVEARVLQNALIDLGKKYPKQSVELYVVNQQSLTNLPVIYHSTPLNLHAISDSTRQHQAKVWQVDGQKNVGINPEGQLGIVTANNLEIVQKGALKVWISTSESAQKTLKASLKAIEEVYQLPIQLLDKEQKEQAQLVCTSQIPQVLNPEVLYLIPESDKHSQKSLASNVIEWSSSMNPQTDDAVFEGKFPAWLLEKILDFQGIKAENNTISNRQLKALFKEQKLVKPLETEWFTAVLITLLVLLLSLERWLAIHRNV